MNVEDKALSELAAEERQSLTDGALPVVRQRLSRTRITEVTQAVVTVAGPIIEQDGPNVYRPAHQAEVVARLRGLERDALVVLAFALAVQNQPHTPTNDAFDALAEELATAERQLERWATAWFADDPVEGPVLQVLRGGRGPRDSAEDVVGYIQMCLRNWDKVKVALPYTREALEELERKATRFLGMVKVIERANEDRLLLGRAYGRFERHVREVLAAATYLISLKPGAKISLPTLSTRN